MRALCLLFCAFVCFLRADSVMVLEQSTQESQKEQNEPASQKVEKEASQEAGKDAPKASKHPLRQGFEYLFSKLHADNFIDLENATSLRQDVQPSAESKDYPNAPTASSQSTLSTNQNKPKVLLIMDDLSQATQIKHLESLQLNITPSLFPQGKYHSHTPKIAKALAQKGKSFMIHLPLEAQNFTQKELEPLKVGISRQALKREIEKIKQDFPNLLYLNNHTGSKFTQSKDDMANLLEIFDELGLKFIDSVTTPKSAASKLAQQQKRLIMARDIFLDNEQNAGYTKKQLESLIKKARKKGYAIAICHPHPSTFEALSQMRQQLESSLDLVAPQQLEEFLHAQNIQLYERSSFF